LYNICPVSFSFQDTRHRQMAQALKLSNRRRLVVIIGVRIGLRPFQGRRQYATRGSLELALTY
jgi:hypothetical protein